MNVTIVKNTQHSYYHRQYHPIIHRSCWIGLLLLVRSFMVLIALRSSSISSCFTKISTVQAYTAATSITRISSLVLPSQQQRFYSRVLSSSSSSSIRKLSLLQQQSNNNNNIKSRHCISFLQNSQRITTMHVSSDATTNHDDTTNTTIQDQDIMLSRQSSYGMDMDQNTLMETDMLVAVNEHDECIVVNNNHHTDDQHDTIMTTTTTTNGNQNSYHDPSISSSSSTVPTKTTIPVHVTKKMGHVFNETTPRGILHRAFSLFIFNTKHELLITQRASNKITFPNVWTNTVCSHPLYHMTPNEVDDTYHDYPNYPGIKYAAIRKCYHELGIPLSMISIQDIQFITKFHYWAADTITYGTNTPWGEHEIDYVLFYQIPNTTIEQEIVSSIQPHDDEVQDYQFVTIQQLQTMIQDPKLLWSPWFIGIMNHGGYTWWEYIQQEQNGKTTSSSIQDGTYTNRNITYFNPPEHHMAQYNLPSHNKYTGIWKSS